MSVYLLKNRESTYECAMVHCLLTGASKKSAYSLLSLVALTSMPQTKFPDIRNAYSERQYGGVLCLKATGCGF